MKIKKILCFGDSITGTCVTGQNTYDGLKFYPYLLGKHFDCEVNNFGLGNNSNEKIAMDVAQSLLNDNFENNFFIINWTTNSRRMYYYEDLYSWNNNNALNLENKSSLMDTFSSLNCVKTTQSLLEDRGIPYLMFIGWRTDYIFEKNKLVWLANDYNNDDYYAHMNVNLKNYGEVKGTKGVYSEFYLNKKGEKITPQVSTFIDIIQFLCSSIDLNCFIKQEFYQFLLNVGIKEFKTYEHHPTNPSKIPPKVEINSVPYKDGERLTISNKDLHPNELGHELWTDEMLIPNIKRIINANTKHK